MVLLRHRAIVSDEVIFKLAKGQRFMLPGTWISDIRFIEQLAVDEYVTFVEGHGLSGQSDNSFHVHDAWPGQADRYHIATLRFVEKVGQPIYAIDAVFAISR